MPLSVNKMITVAQLEQHCLSYKAAVKTFPFGFDTAVYKVMGKMFALHPVATGDEPLTISLKCDPDWSLLLRQHYSGITAGYHLNKKHWNSVRLDQSIPDDEIWEMITHSYNLVVSKLRKTDREKLAELPA